MGNQTTQEQFTNYQQIERINYKGIFELIHYQDRQTLEPIILIRSDYLIQNIEMALSQIIQLKKINELKNAFILTDFGKEAKKQLCLTNYKINLLFESHNTNLYSMSSQLFNQSGTIEKTLWVIFYDLIDYLNDLELLQLNNGDFQPQYIYLSENKIVKVFTPLIYTNFRNAYMAMLVCDSYRSPLSPELIEFFDFRVRNPKYDEQKSDIFSMFLCVLCLLSGKQYEEYYDFKKPIIYLEQINSDLIDVIRIYELSNELHMFFKNGLEEKVNLRSSLKELNQNINFKRKTRSKVFTAFQYIN